MLKNLNHFAKKTTNQRNKNNKYRGRRFKADKFPGQEEYRFMSKNLPEELRLSGFDQVYLSLLKGIRSGAVTKAISYLKSMRSGNQLVDRIEVLKKSSFKGFKEKKFRKLFVEILRIVRKKDPPVIVRVQKEEKTKELRLEEAKAKLLKDELEFKKIKVISPINRK
jgi:hypothetical protein